MHLMVFPVLVALAMTVSGCVADVPKAVEDVEVVADTAPALPTPEEPPVLVHPLLLNVSARLRDSAAELVVPAGEYHLVRLVYDADVWGEELPWDGESEVYVGLAARTNGTGVIMDAFGFQPPSFVEDRTIRPAVTFNQFTGDISGWAYTMSNCSGCDEDAPRHERGVLVGADQPVTLRIGVLGATWTDDELWGRPAVAVASEATTREAFAGYAIRVLGLAGDETAMGGIMAGSWSDAVAPGVNAGRTSSYVASAPITEAGIFSVKMYGNELAGVEEWSYSLDAPGLKASWSGPWVHEPSGYGILLAASGAAYPPILSAQGNVQTGDMTFRADRSLMSVSDPTGVGELSFELAVIGHAGVDLDALYGWETGRDPTPGNGFLHCVAWSMVPAQPCLGT